MKNKNKKVLYPPLVFNLYKPSRVSSQDFIRGFKRILPRTVGKIGHFGTLDPFASGVLMVGVAGAARLNDYIHAHLPKTYLAVGKLGIETDSGDYTGTIVQLDTSEYLKNVIGDFSKEFVAQKIEPKFIGKYMQSPPSFSAAKFNGRALHEWAREGVMIHKPEVERTIYKMSIVRYQFPYIGFRVTVSSGTYIRSLFNDIAQALGTVGTLISLKRESVGGEHFKSCFSQKNYKDLRDDDLMKLAKPIQEILDFKPIYLSTRDTDYFKNGRFMKREEEMCGPLWIYGEDKLIGLGKIEDQLLKPIINFSHDIMDSSSELPS